MNDRRQPPLRRFTFTRVNPERRETERRESPRFAVSASVRFLRATSDGPDVIDGEVIEASLTGMRVILDQPVRKNEQLLVEVSSEFHGGFNIFTAASTSRRRSCGSNPRLKAATSPAASSARSCR